MIERKEKLKDIEVRVLAELMKNSRRSDREIAKTVGVSQPTVSRVIKNLERKRVIKEYTTIPDFTQLGYTMMGATLMKIDEPSKEKLQEVRKATTKVEKVDPHSALIAVNGNGLEKNRLLISFYENYSDFSRTIELARRIPSVNVDSIQTFLVDLNDETHFRVLGLSAFAQDLLQRLEKKNEPIPSLGT